MPKLYTCKATGCTAKFERVYSSLQIVCGQRCAIDYATQQNKKKAEQTAKQSRKALREYNRRDLRWQHKQTQPAFNRMRVLEEMLWFEMVGLEPTCISCNKPNMDWCCGHFKTRGAQPELRYDRKNTYLQCNKYCNSSLSGNIEGNKHTRGYKQGLVDRFGESEAAEIMEYCDQFTLLNKWSWQELEAMRKQFNKKIRLLEAARATA